MYVSHRFNHNCPTPKLVSTLAFGLRPLPSLVPRLLHCRKTGPGSSLFFCFFLFFTRSDPGFRSNLSFVYLLAVHTHSDM